MLDFLMVSTRSTKRGVIEVYPKFIICRSTDLMIRGGDFYAVWIEDKGLWSTDEQDLISLVDSELDAFANANREKFDGQMKVLHMWDSETGMIDVWHKYCQRQQRDIYRQLDTNLIFSNQKTKKSDYASKTLPYPLEEGPIDNWDELILSLYSEDERYKIEWAIGSIVSGASKKLEKFIVLYGAPGTGKGTILKVIEKLFTGYTAVFDAHTLGSNSDFALEAFKTNPLVAIQYDGDLSKIENNARLNSLISHEKMVVNEKHKSLYSSSFNSFPIIGTNKPVKITDAKSGLLRRLIDVTPLGNKIPRDKYNDLMTGIDFELGHIAKHCEELYLNDPNAFDDYTPTLMMGESNDFYNFMLDRYIVFRKDDGVTLKAAWEMYKQYCEEARVQYSLTMRQFKTELMGYFQNYEERSRIDDITVRSYYSGFKTSMFESKEPNKNKTTNNKKENNTWLKFENRPSNLDIYCADCLAQYASDNETPKNKWSEVTSKLSDIDTSKLHYLMVPDNLIVIDFDIKDENGNKSFERNLEAANKWPKTYAELSKSGGGIHLHYLYNGDVNELCRIYATDIEIKVYTGKSSLRRKVTKCTDNIIATISSGLPTKGDSKVINFESVKNERALRTIIKKNLNKEYHGATKPSMDFIFKVIEDCYNSGMKYDISDLHNTIIAFAANSTNQSDYCLKLVTKMHFMSDELPESSSNNDQPIVFFDVEVYPNLFICCYKKEGPKHRCVKMINPTKEEIEKILSYRLVGFNCRRYDNHILYARLLGRTNEELYKISQDIINDKKSGTFGQAYNISYTDIYDYSKTKQSLKKWEIQLGIHHKEMDIPWDQPAPKDKWDEIADYCCNDVIATEAVWNETKEDFRARTILADLADMTVNDTTNSLTAKIVFKGEKNPALVYHDLREEFPEYEFVKTWNEATQKYDMQNMYLGEDVGFGGYIHAEEGIYYNVALLDIASMHPHSAIAMNVFGEYTKNYENIVETRVDIKHKDFESAKLRWNGKIDKYLENEDGADALSASLKLPINAVYGLTSAKFDNPFRDPRNENNIVALRGALFMKTLKENVTNMGYKVVHIKTDSIKIENADKKIIDYCMDFAKKYGYTFEHEATYSKMCLVNDAVYIAKYASIEACEKLYGKKYVESSKDVLKENKKHPNDWTATGTQFSVPYVYKKCFTNEPIEFKDLCETKQVNSVMYLDKNEGDLKPFEQQFRNVKTEDGEKRKVPRTEPWGSLIDDYEITECSTIQFIGKVGLFCPIKPGCKGGILLRENKDRAGKIKYDSVVGTKGYRWLESEEVYENNMQDCIDLRYYDNLVEDAVEVINKYGDYDSFISEQKDNKKSKILTIDESDLPIK